LSPIGVNSLQKTKEPVAKDTNRPDTGKLNRKAAEAVIRKVELQPGQAIIFSRGPMLLLFRGDLKAAEATDIAVQVADTWNDAGQTVRIQFMRLPLLPTECLLYTIYLNAKYLLTIVDAADAPFLRVKRLAEAVQAGFSQFGLAPEAV
jgi:hypothetical protein